MNTQKNDCLTNSYNFIMLINNVLIVINCKYGIFMTKSLLLSLALLFNGVQMHTSENKPTSSKDMLAKYWPSDRLMAFNYSSVPVVVGSIIWPFLVWKTNTDKLRSSIPFDFLFVTEKK
jgi:hypothetical protein